MCVPLLSHGNNFYHFCKKMCRERRIPFEISVDPFFSSANMTYLARITSTISLIIMVEFYLYYCIMVPR